MKKQGQYLEGLYGSHIKREKAVAYCYFHKKHLTVATLKKRGCLKKNCDSLKRHEHEYWRQRELKKQQKKARYNNDTKRDDYSIH